MKNFVTLLALTMITFTAAMANVNPTMETVEVEQLEIFTSTNFDTASETLDFTTTKDIAVIQIYNEKGELTFQLPVMSNNVQINKNLFGQGVHKMGFVIDGENDVHLTTVRIK